MNSYQKCPGKGLFSGLTNRSPFAAILVTMLMLAISSTSFGQSPEIKKALRYIDIEQPSKGLSALEQMAGNNAANLYYLGLAQIRTGAKDKALATFEKGIAADDKNGLNYAGKGHVRLLEKNPTDAKVQLDKALQVSRSKDVAVLKAVAEAYLTDTKYLLDAINVLNKAKGMAENDPEIHLLLGDAFLLQNVQNAGPTVSAYERAAKADPKSAKPHYKIGKIYQRARSNDNAIASFEKAISIDPEYAPAFKELGEISYVNKQPEKAVEAYEKYLAVTENPGQAKFQLAFFYFMAKKFDKANAIFKEVTTNPNVSPVALRYYAYSLTEQNKSDDPNKLPDPAKTQEARATFDKYFQRAKPEELQGSDYLYFGKLLLATKEDSLANINFTKAVDMDSSQVEAASLNAETYFKRKKFAEAIGAYNQVISMRQTPMTIELFNLGRSYYLEGQYKEADSLFAMVAEKAPTQTLGPLWAAKARQQIDSTGSMALANPMFEKVIEIGSADTNKFKKDLIEAYMYFVSYYINIKEDVPKAKGYLEKVLALDPAHAQANEALKVINAPAPKQNKGSQK
jgi:tetratricopeptide (TPR) repeat protein